jgi:arylsulfatase A-like enzyme
MNRRPLILGLAFCLAASGLEAQPTSANRPNVVLIMTDDVGYGDFGSYGAPDVRTPNLDGLARAGVRFTDFYAAPTCTPTRAALITGRYQQRVGLEMPIAAPGTPRGEPGLAATGRSLPQLLKNNGYSTALIGKWHLGYKPEHSPNAHGFEYFFGFLSGYIDYYRHTGGDGKPDLYENGTPVRRDGYMTDLITARSIEFIEAHARGPFFLQVNYNAAHWPFQVPDLPSVAPGNARFLQPIDEPTSARKDYVAMVERADRGAGEILAALRKLGLERGTLVIFTNDNGGEWLSRNTPLFHRKETLWEGGIRVPLILRWPGRIPAGRVTDQVGITMDLTASILAATGTRVPPEARLEGIDLLPIVRRASPAVTVTRTVFFRMVTPRRHQRAVRDGDWKLIVDGGEIPSSPVPAPSMLFNLREDIGERNDLARDRPEIVRRLRRLLAQWERDVDGK